MKEYILIKWNVDKVKAYRVFRKLVNLKKYYNL